MDVLDVACGTGVLFPDYLARDVHSVTGVDIAPEMARRAAEKFPDARVTVRCGDIETVPLPQPFDCCTQRSRLATGTDMPEDFPIRGEVLIQDR